MSGPLTTHADGYDDYRALCEAYEHGPVPRHIHDLWMKHVTPSVLAALIVRMRRYRGNWYAADDLRKLAEQDLAEMLGEPC